MRALAIACLAALPAFAQAQALTTDQEQAVDARIRAYILENPEIIMEAVEILRAREADAQSANDADLIAAHAAELFQDEAAPMLGAPDGDVTVVEFGDYNCGYCKRAHPVLAELMASDKGVRIVYKQFPILGPNSVLAARAAMAAQALDATKFEALHDAFYTHRGALDEAMIFRIAGEIGLAEAELRAAMDTQEVADAIQANYQLGKALDINGTPAFIVGDEILRGAAPLEEFERLAAKARGETQ